MSTEPVSFSLEINLSPEAQSQIRQTQTILYRTAGIIRSMSGSASLNTFISRAQRGIMIANQLRLAALAAKTAMLGAGPLGWIMFGLSVAEVGVSVVSALPNDELDMELDAR